MKSILLHIDHDAAMAARLQVALDIARSTNGHITCVQTVNYNVFATGDVYGAAIAAALLPAQRSLLLAALALALVGIALQLVLRLWTRRQFQVPLTLWWLMGAGALVVAAIGPVSVWRTLSGRGWTWKGRPLA